MGMYEPDSRGIIPLEGSWSPTPEDTVVGVVMEQRKGKVYMIDLMFFGRCLLDTGEVRRVLLRARRRHRGEDNGRREQEDHSARATAKLLEGGRIIRVKPKKVLRVIGKKNTMIDQIKELTKTDIVVGLNGHNMAARRQHRAGRRRRYSR